MAGSSTDTSPAAFRRRSLELTTAGALTLVGLVVAADSLAHDVRWNENGPAPGYFPFRVGLLLVVSSLALLVRSARGPLTTAFVTRGELRRTAGVLWPTMIAVLAMFLLGCYVPSSIYLAWMMRRHGRYSWPRSIGGAFLVTACLVLVFEFWFQVPLAKGPVEAAFGIY